MNGQPMSWWERLKTNPCNERFIDRVFTGSFRAGPVVVYGANAMHWALNVKTPWGLFCVHPTTRTFGGYWPWYVYLSKDGTPSQREGNLRFGYGLGMWD